MENSGKRRNAPSTKQSTAGSKAKPPRTKTEKAILPALERGVPSLAAARIYETLRILQVSLPTNGLPGALAVQLSIDGLPYYVEYVGWPTPFGAGSTTTWLVNSFHCLVSANAESSSPESK